MGIEPTSEAWEASILPLYDARSAVKLTKLRNSCKNSSRALSVLECAFAWSSCAVLGVRVTIRVRYLHLLVAPTFRWASWELSRAGCPPKGGRYMAGSTRGYLDSEDGFGLQ